MHSIIISKLIGWAVLTLFAALFVFVAWLMSPLFESASTRKYKLDEAEQQLNKEKEILNGKDNSTKETRY